MHTHTYIHTYMHTYIHTHAYIHTCIHTYIYTHISKPNTSTLRQPYHSPASHQPATSHQPSHHHHHPAKLPQGGGVVSYCKKAVFRGSPRSTRQFMLFRCLGSWWAWWAFFLRIYTISSSEGPRIREIRVRAPEIALRAMFGGLQVLKTVTALAGGRFW